MNWGIIKSVKAYEAALNRLEIIFDSDSTKDSEEAELLTLLIENYEAEKYPIPEPDPVEAIKFIMEQTSLKPVDLVGILGNKASVSRVLNRKRTLTIEMVRKLHARFNLPYEVLMKPYKVL